MKIERYESGKGALVKRRVRISLDPQTEPSNKKEAGDLAHALKEMFTTANVDTTIKLYKNQASSILGSGSRTQEMNKDAIQLRAFAKLASGILETGDREGTNLRAAMLAGMKLEEYAMRVKIRLEKNAGPEQRRKRKETTEDTVKGFFEKNKADWNSKGKTIENAVAFTQKHLAAENTPSLGKRTIRRLLREAKVFPEIAHRGGPRPREK